MKALTQVIGDSRTHRIPLRWSGSSFSPDESWTLLFTVKSDPDTQGDEDASIQKASGAGLTVDGDDALVALVHQDTAGDAEADPVVPALAPGKYEWDIQAQNTDTGEVRTVARGTLELIQGVTRNLESAIPIITTEPPAFPVAGAVRYDTAQSLTSPQKVQARTNIGLDSLQITASVAVANAAARLALSAAAARNVAVVEADTGKSYMLISGGTPSSAGDWLQLGDNDVAWGDVSGKPSTFAPSAHTHPLSEITDAGTSAGYDYTTSDTPPVSPSNGDKWLDTSSGIEYVRYDDQWITGDSPSPAPNVTAANLDFTGSTDIGADLADEDQIMVSDGGGNTTRRKSAISRIWTYVLGKIGANASTVRSDLGLGTAATKDSSTGGNGAADAGKVVEFGPEGGASFSAQSDVAVRGDAVDGIGAYGVSQSGIAVFGNATDAGFGGMFASGTGVALRAETGTGDYHASFGNADSNGSFVARVLSAFGWWRGAYTLMVSAVDTLTANRVQLFQDASGTIALTSDIPTTPGEVGAAAASHTHAVTDLDIAGGTEINDALADGDLIPVRDVSGTPANKTTLVSRIWTYIKAKIDAGSNTFAGAQTFSGQIELTNQAATTATSAMTRGLADTRYGQIQTIALASDLSAASTVEVLSTESVTLAAGTYILSGQLYATTNSTTAGVDCYPKITAGAATLGITYYRAAVAGLDAYTTMATNATFQAANSVGAIGTFATGDPSGAKRTAAAFIPCSLVIVPSSATFKLAIAQRSGTDASNPAIARSTANVLAFRKIA